LAPRAGAFFPTQPLTPLLADQPQLRARFARQQARAVRRIRVQRALWALGWALAPGAMVLIAAAGLVFLWPGLAPLLLPLAAAALAAVLLAALLAGLWPVPAHEALARADRELELPDHGVSAAELQAGHAADAFWRERVLREAVAALEAADWRARWPLRWPRVALPSAVAFTGACALCLAFALLVFAATPPPPRDLAPARDALEETREAVREQARREEDPRDRREWEELDRRLAGFEEKLQREEAATEDLREMLVALNRAREQIEQMRREARAESAAANTEQLARALDQMRGLGEAAAALRRQELQEAARAVQRRADQLTDMLSQLRREPGEGEQQAQAGAQGERVPAGQMAADPEQARASLQEVIDELRQQGRDALADALEKLKNALESGDARQLQEALEELAQHLNREGARQQSQSTMQSLMAGMSDLRSLLADSGTPAGGQGGEQGQMPGMGQGESPGQEGGQPGQGQGQGEGEGEGEEGSGQGGLMAGTGSEETFGEATDINALEHLSRVRGEQGSEGASAVRILKAASGSGSTTRPGDAQAVYEAYRKRSFQAIEDESLPRAHRESIRRYFEAIRPRYEEPASGDSAGGAGTPEAGTAVPAETDADMP